MSLGPGPRRPRPVLTALVLLWSALALMLGGSALYIYSSPTPVPPGDIAVAFLGYALMAALVFEIGRANVWARIVCLVLVGWSVGLFVINTFLQSRHLLGLVVVDIVAMALQLCAMFALFMRSSNDWFRRSAAPAPAKNSDNE
jgi:hypothetical protein